MTFAGHCISVFEKAVLDYHVTDDVDAPMREELTLQGPLDAILYRKCWIDAVQWHLEDIIRDPDIDPSKALAIKRRIDRSNQARTDIVEEIDSYFLDTYSGVGVMEGAGLNTESPAWALDRLSILVLKIHHMREQAARTDGGEAHAVTCGRKLEVLLEQREDLSRAIDELLSDLASGRKRMKVYRQMKMYNDPSTNPVLYAKDSR